MAHVSTGDMLRERVLSGDELGRQVASIMRTGGLVPDDAVNRMVEDRVEQPDCAKGFILDGYPRTVNQARLLGGLLAALAVSPLVVHLEVDYNVIITRLSGRRQCPTCGALYGVSSNAPTVSEVCDYDGSKLVVREDDQEDVVRARLLAYEKQTTPVLTFLKEAGYRCKDVEGAGESPIAIARKIETLIREHQKSGGEASA